MFDVVRNDNSISFRPRSEKDTMFAGMRIDHTKDIELDRWFILSLQAGKYFLGLIEKNSEVTYEETKKEPLDCR